MASLEFLLVRLPAFSDLVPQVFAGQAATGVTQVEEEDIVDLIDRVGGSELLADRLQLLAHGAKRHDQQELRRFPQTDELTHPPQRPVDQLRSRAAALGHAGSERMDHGLGFGLASVELRNRVKITGIEAQIVADHSKQVTGVIRPARHTQINFGDGAMAVAAQKRL